MFPSNTKCSDIIRVRTTQAQPDAISRYGCLCYDLGLTKVVTQPKHIPQLFATYSKIRESRMCQLEREKKKRSSSSGGQC